jgi:hypothetical protein
MLLSNRDGMKVEERGHHSHGQWKLPRLANPDPILNWAEAKEN